MGGDPLAHLVSYEGDPFRDAGVQIWGREGGTFWDGVLGNQGVVGPWDAFLGGLDVSKVDGDRDLGDNCTHPGLPHTPPDHIPENHQTQSCHSLYLHRKRGRVIDILNDYTLAGCKQRGHWD